MASNASATSGGSKYTGFGSDDLKKYSGGYDIHGATTGGSGGYDPYKQKGGSLFSGVKAKDIKSKKEDKPKKKAKKTKKKKKSESESEDDSDDSSDDKSDSEESSEEEKPKKEIKTSKAKAKKETKKGLSNPAKKQPASNKTIKKVVKEPEVKKQDLFELFDTNESPPVQSVDNSGLAGLGIDFGQPAPNTHRASNNTNIFDNVNFGGGNNQPTNISSNMPVTNVNIQPAPVNTAPAPVAGGGWDPFGQSNQPAAQPAAQPTFNNPNPSANDVMNMFGNMSMSQPINSTPATGGGFNMFEGMSQTAVNSNVNTTPSQPQVDDFGDFQDSNPSPVVQKAPPKDDAWGMGGGLFNLSGLVKNSEKKDKLSSHHTQYKPSPEKNMLHTQADDLNSGNIWSGAFGGPAQQHPSNQHPAQANYGGANSMFPTSNQPSGYSYNQNSNNQFPNGQQFGSNQYSTGFGGNNMQMNSGYSSGGFPSAGGFPNAQPQPQANQWPTQGSNNNAGGFPPQTQNTSPFY
jgi:hypothetical protein